MVGTNCVEKDWRSVMVWRGYATNTGIVFKAQTATVLPFITFYFISLYYINNYYSYHYIEMTMFMSNQVDCGQNSY